MKRSRRGLETSVVEGAYRRLLAIILPPGNVQPSFRSLTGLPGHPIAASATPTTIKVATSLTRLAESRTVMRAIQFVR